MPKISLCVPTCNRASLLRQCLSTLLAQTARDVEVLVVDNGSVDETEAVVGAFSQDPRLRYVRNPQNLGPQGNWNRCLELARGEHIAICHDDDLYAPDFAEACSAFLDRHPSVGFVHCGHYVTDAGGTPLKTGLAYPTDRVLPSAEIFLQFLLNSHNVTCPSVMARRTAYDAAGQFRVGVYAGDYDMWLRMAFRFDVGYVSRLLVYYRMHGHNTTREIPLRRFYDEHVMIVEEALATAAGTMPHLSRERNRILGRVRARWARRGLREALSRASSGDIDAGRRYLTAARSLAPALSLRMQIFLAHVLLSPPGAFFLQRLRPSWHYLHRARAGRAA